jgi:anti-sigma regulatory factor (Ser/Thr protein kinase)
MRHTAMVILEMKYSKINPRLEILDGRIKCFETAEEAISHAKKKQVSSLQIRHCDLWAIGIEL